MSTVHIPRRARVSRRSHRRLIPIVLAAIAGLAVSVALIALQVSARGEKVTLPARVATGDGRVLGDAAAPVTIVMYADFQCPACKYAEMNIVPRLEEQYVLTGKANIEFRMFPFLGQESWDAAQAAEAAREQGKFWEYHDALWNAQAGENRGAFSYGHLVALAHAVGLDVPRFEETLLSNRYLQPIQQEVDAAGEAGVASTPTFFIGEQKIVGAHDYEVFRAAIERALAEPGS